MGKRSTYEPRPRDFKGDNNPSYKHGHSQRGKRSPEYKVWVGVRKRINDPNCNIYPYYGGRGITYDPSWEDFSVFLQDVGERPSTDHTLDRIDPNKNYCKENVRWATRYEQSRNKRSNIVVEGVILKDWCKEKTFNYKTVWRWLVLEGKDIEYAIKRGSELWVKEATT